MVSAVEAFVPEFADAIDRGDIDFLYETLHPVVTELFDEELCRSYVEAEILPLTRELGIGFVPYAPLGRGFLTATIGSPEVLEGSDRRHDHPRFALRFDQNVLDPPDGMCRRCSPRGRDIQIDRTVPFSPFLEAGALLTVVLGGPITEFLRQFVRAESSFLFGYTLEWTRPGHVVMAASNDGDREAIVGHGDRARIQPVNRVIFEQVGQRRRVRQVVESDELQVRVVTKRSSQRVSSNSAETRRTALPASRWRMI